MHAAASSKSQFLMLKSAGLLMPCFSASFLFELARGVLMPLVPLMCTLKVRCKCWTPVWNATLRKFLGHFLRSDVGPG